MERRHLSEIRSGVVHKFHVGTAEGYIRTGTFEDGQLGEVFINMAKSTDSGPWGCVGILLSASLQRGIPLKDLVRKLAYTRFEPSGVTRNKTLPMATSVMDYIMRWLWTQYGDGTDPFQE
jgi:ribonucleoside-diphosphate reductase alpha chain